MASLRAFLSLSTPRVISGRVNWPWACCILRNSSYSSHQFRDYSFGSEGRHRSGRQRLWSQPNGCQYSGGLSSGCQSFISQPNKSRSFGSQPSGYQSIGNQCNGRQRFGNQSSGCPSFRSQLSGCPNFGSVTSVNQRFKFTFMSDVGADAFSIGYTYRRHLHTSSASSRENKIPSKCDVLIVGGGAMGSSIAYHLKKEVGDGLSVVVVEEDDTYKTASTVLSLGCIRQQFTVPENILLSMYGIQFLKEAHHLLRVPEFDPPDVQFHPRGFLMLASEETRDQLLENYNIQVDTGAKLEAMTQSQLKSRYPWMSTHGLAMGVLGVENEGWFDPWTLLTGFRRKAEYLGTHYVQGKVTAINDRLGSPAENLNTAHVATKASEIHEIEFSTVVMAAGYRSGAVSKLAGVGTGEGLLATPLPVEPRKRYVYYTHVPEGPVEDCPIFCDPSASHFRPEKTPKMFLCIRNPTKEEEPSTEDFEVDHSYFEDIIWPSLASRVPAFQNLKVLSSWAGFYDYNTLDQNAVIGKHPVFNNLIFATGFSGHGIQHSPGIGRAVMEYLLHGGYRTINLERFGFERIVNNEPLVEKNVL